MDVVIILIVRSLIRKTNSFNINKGSLSTIPMKKISNITGFVEIINASLSLSFIQ